MSRIHALRYGRRLAMRDPARAQAVLAKYGGATLHQRPPHPEFLAGCMTDLAEANQH